MEKARMGRAVFSRENSDNDWDREDFDSISKAKAFNGLNSRTVESAPKNPVREETDADETYQPCVGEGA